MPRIVHWIAAAGLSIGLTIGALGVATAAAPAEGLRLARQWCTSCHIVAPGTGGSDVAPPFQTIANSPNVTDGGLRAWLADPHPPMPNFDLTRAETDALIAYIKSLKRE
ncbi:MAG: c-type cytochrome [Alphaproteobacteria bacterium]